MAQPNQKHIDLKAIALCHDTYNKEAIKAADQLKKQYQFCPVGKADCIVALGGDGFMLQIMHQFIDKDVPIYGMNFGSVGFLMNDYSAEDLFKRVQKSELSYIRPLQMTAKDNKGKSHKALAFNEVSIFRSSHQAAKLSIEVDGKKRMMELTSDGILVATPAGSTAYNLSVYGPILPLDANLLALTPISPFRPRGWRGALLPSNAKVHISVLEAEKRPVSAVADAKEVEEILEATIEEMPDLKRALLFDPGHALDERILREQFRL